MLTRADLIQEHDVDPLDDDAEWERWMALSDEEQEAEVDRETQRLQRVWKVVQRQRDRMPRRQLARVLARECLEMCLRHRIRADRLRELHAPEVIVEMSRKSLRESQRELLKIRGWRASGPIPGREA